MCKTNKGYHIILIDIGLPGIDGLEATRQIRAHEAGGNQHSRIIALTAYAISDYRDKCMQAGLDEIANKIIVEPP